MSRGRRLVPNRITDLQHHLYSLTYDEKLFQCRFDKNKQIHRVLDVGTGTGIWAMDFGEKAAISQGKTLTEAS